MDRKAGTATHTPAEALSIATTAALYAVSEMLKAARSAGNGIAIEAAEFSIEALLTAAQDQRRPQQQVLGGNVVRFPGC